MENSNRKETVKMVFQLAPLVKILMRLNKPFWKNLFFLSTKKNKIVLKKKLPKITVYCDLQSEL